MKKKLLAISSGGGHWVQLCRLRPAFRDSDVVYVSVSENRPKVIGDATFYRISDSNLSDFFKLFKTFWDAFKIVSKVRPQVILTTGAAPGILCVFWGRVFGARTIWIDSIANSEKLSLSGRLAKVIAHEVLTQWPNIASGRVKYKGAVL